jgi:S-adenosylmethionine hydrolase
MMTVSNRPTDVFASARSSQLQSLRNAGYIEYWNDPDNDRVRITEVGRGMRVATAFAQVNKAMPTVTIGTVDFLRLAHKRRATRRSHSIRLRL